MVKRAFNQRAVARDRLARFLSAMTLTTPNSTDETGPSSPAAVARRIERLMECFKIGKESDTKFAARYGFSQSRWSNYKNSIRLPSIQSAIELREAFRVTLDWIYLGETAGLPRDVYEAITKK